jgi:CSLREA domain-containing protein
MFAVGPPVVVDLRVSSGMMASRSTLVRSRVCWLAALAVGVVACVSLASPVVAAAATLTVNTTKDELVRHDGRCSLREAIEAVNAPWKRTDCGSVSRRSNAIVLRPGRYTLSIPPVGVDDNTSGDLTVVTTAPLKITGAGVGATVIEARWLGDRVLSVASGARLTLVRLRITGGRPPDAPKGSSGAAGVGCAAGGAGAAGLDAAGTADGGGIFNSGTLVLDMVAVTGNTAGAGGAGGSAGSSGCGGGNGGQGGSGGGMYNLGSLTMTDSTVQGNTAGAGGAGGGGDANPLEASGPGGSGGSGGSGGGIYSQGRLLVTASTIYENGAGVGGVGGQAGAGIGPRGADGSGGQGASGGGIFSASGSLRVTNSTLFNNLAGAGAAGGGVTGAGGDGGSGGAIAVAAGPSVVRNATVADNRVGAGGAPGSTAARPGASGLGGGLFAQSSTTADDMSLQNTIVASGLGSGCAGSTRSAIANDGHDLSYGDKTCPGPRGNPKLGPLKDNGGSTKTMAIGAGSAAIDRIPRKTGDCPSTDQRGVRRPQGRACDIGAFEFASPEITMIAPFPNAAYERRSRVLARFRCDEGGVASTIATCKGSIARGHAIRTGRLGTVRFVVTAIDKSGNRARKTIHYDVWEYVNPLQQVSGLTPRRIDLGVDYAGSGPLLALGRGRVTMASNTDSGPPSCWAISCWPGGGIVVYQLLDGPFAGNYVYVAEHITVSVSAGQTVSAGQQIATLYAGYPWSEWGWAAGPGPEALAMTDGHRCPCGDPGGWSTIDGRNMNQLLVRLGAPSGYLQTNTPNQSMPPGWPSWSG